MRATCLRFCLIALLAACGGASKKAQAQLPPPAPLVAEAYAHYLRGQVAFFEGDFARAVPELKNALRVAPDEVFIALALVSALYESGDLAATQREIQGAQARWPQSAQVWIKSAALARATDNHAAAAAAYHRAIKLGAHTLAVQLDYASELSAIGKSKRASALYRQINKDWPTSEEAHYQLARLLHAADSDSAATRHLEKASSLSPYDLRIWALLSVTLRSLGDNDAAVQALRRPFDRNGGDAQIAEQLFIELLELGPEAQAHRLVHVLDRDDLSIDTRIGMGHLQLRIADFAGALATSERLSGELRANAPIVELRARALRGLHRPKDAKAELLTVGDSDPGYTQIRAMLAELLADQGKFGEADQILQETSASFPDDAEVILARATILAQSGKIDEGRRLLLEAITKHPHAGRARYALAEIESVAGRSAEAIKAVMPLVIADPRDAAALNYVGYTLIDTRGGTARAAALLQRALELSPDSPFILDSYGWLLLRSGQLDRARPFLERAARLTPAEPDVIAHLAELCWLAGQHQESAALFRRAHALTLNPTRQRKIDERQQWLQQKP